MLSLSEPSTPDGYTLTPSRPWVSAASCLPMYCTAITVG